MKNPYDILGVQKTADAAAIRAAYRKLAKTHHPDLNPGKPEAAERFKEISIANELLSDADKRARFDRGEIDATGQERAPERPFYRDAQGRGRYQQAGGFTEDDVESFFHQAFGKGAGGSTGRTQGRARGKDARYTLTVGFLEAANGTTRRIALPDQRTLDVKIPAGTEDGHVLRLKGQGGTGFGGAPNGDALVEIAVAPDPFFKREGDDIVIDLPVTIREAVLGATVEVPTISGKVRLAIPPGSGSGTRLRLRGRGLREGHQFVRLKIVLPPGEEPALAAFLRDWEPSQPFDPRAGLGES